MATTDECLLSIYTQAKIISEHLKRGFVRLLSSDAGSGIDWFPRLQLSTNQLAEKVQELFEKDYDIGEQYHQLLDGKWNQSVSISPLLGAFSDQCLSV